MTKTVTTKKPNTQLFSKDMDQFYSNLTFW